MGSVIASVMADAERCALQDSNGAVHERKVLPGPACSIRPGQSQIDCMLATFFFVMVHVQHHIVIRCMRVLHFKTYVYLVCLHPGA